MEPVDYLRIVRRRWRLVVGLTLVGAVLAFLTAPQPRPRSLTPVPSGASSYTATATLIQLQTFGSAGGASTATVPLTTAAFLLTVGDVPKRAAQQLHFSGDPAVLASQVQSKPDAAVGSLQVTVSGSDAAPTTNIANAFADQLIAYLDEQAASRRNQAIAAANANIKSIEDQLRSVDGQLPTGAAATQPNPHTESLQAEHAALVASDTAAYQQLNQLTTAGPATGGLVSFQKATPIPVNPNNGGITSVHVTGRSARAGLGGLVGLLLGVVLALLLERVDTRLWTKEATERSFGFPVVAETPDVPGKRRLPVVLAAPQSPAAEAYRTLRTSLLLMPLHRISAVSPNGSQESPWLPDDRSVPPGAGRARRPRVVLVSAVGPDEDSGMVVANLAAALGEAAYSVIVLDCDFLKGTAARYLSHGDPGPGLSDLFESRLVAKSRATVPPTEQAGRPGWRPGWPGGPGQAQESILAGIVAPTPAPGVRLVPPGTGSRRPAAFTAGIEQVVATANDLADIVLIDTSPLLLASDAGELVPLADAVLVVARAGRVTADAAGRASELLGRVGAPVLGVVLTDMPVPGTGWRDRLARRRRDRGRAEPPRRPAPRRPVDDKAPPEAARARGQHRRGSPTRSRSDAE